MYIYGYGYNHINHIGIIMLISFIHYVNVSISRTTYTVVVNIQILRTIHNILRGWDIARCKESNIWLYPTCTNFVDGSTTGYATYAHIA